MLAGSNKGYPNHRKPLWVDRITCTIDFVEKYKSRLETSDSFHARCRSMHMRSLDASIVDASNLPTNVSLQLRIVTIRRPYTHHLLHNKCLILS